MRRRLPLALLGLSTLVLVNCGSDEAQPEAAAPPATTQQTDEVFSLLRQATSCDDLGASLKADATAKLDIRVDAELAAARAKARAAAATAAAGNGDFDSAGSTGDVGGGAPTSSGTGGASSASSPSSNKGGGPNAAAGAATSSGGSATAAGGFANNPPGGATGGSSAGMPPEGFGGSAGSGDMGAGGDGTQTGGAQGGAGGNAESPDPAGGAGGIADVGGSAGVQTGGAGGAGVVGGDAGANSGTKGGSSGVEGGAPGSAGAPPIGAAGAAGDPSSGTKSKPAIGTEKPGAFSKTNTQVGGVDEADIVKTDGNFIYLLHGNRLEVINAWPVSGIEQVGDFVVEGTPIDLYVYDGTAVVLSHVDADAVFSRASRQRRPAYDETALAGSITPKTQKNIVTKITRIDAAASAPRVGLESYFEGQHLSSRRIGKQLRVVVNGIAHGPAITATPPDGSNLTEEEVDKAFSDYRKKAKEQIDGSKTEDWLPSYLTSAGGSSLQEQTPSCQEFYIPGKGTTEHGVVRVQNVDLDSGSTSGMTFVGKASAIYATRERLYVAATAYIDPTAVAQGVRSPALFAASEDAKVAALAPEGALQGADASGPPSQVTYLHQFDFGDADAAPVHRSSGGIVGAVERQYWMDERDGALRVVTAEARTTTTGTSTSVTRVNHLFALRDTGRVLKLIGDAGPIGAGNPVTSTRFVGSRAFVDTNTSGKSLTVLDVSDANNPRKLGETAIPGYASYMHPIGDKRLLTVVRDGLDLYLYVLEISDDGTVREVAKAKVGTGSSELEYNEKALAYLPALGLIALPLSNAQLTGTKSSLEVFSLTLTAESVSLSKTLSIDHSELFAEQAKQGKERCLTRFGNQMRRGLFLDSFAYAISYAGITVHDLNDHTETREMPNASLVLPVPELPEGETCVQ